MKKKNKKNPTGLHCINMYINFDTELGACYYQGDPEVLTTMLFGAAQDYPELGDALLDAAVKYLDYLEEEQGGPDA